MNVLKLDAAGTPQQWLEFDEAAYYLTQGKVAWSIGEPCITLRGGMNAESGVQSTLALPPIMAIRGEVFASRNYRPVSCERLRLFRRDRHVCAYCAMTFRESELTADHVIPESRGGEWSWSNLVSACRLYRSKSLPVLDVSEWSPGKAAKKRSARTRNAYQFALRVHKEVQ